MRILRIALAVLLVASCKQSKSKLDDVGLSPTLPPVPTAPNAGSAHVLPSTPITPPKDITTKDVLARPNTSDDVYVKWVLFSWKDLADHGFPLDPRAQNRSNDDAAQLALDTLGKLKADPKQIGALAKSLSEQPGGTDDEAIELNKDVPMSPEMKPLLDLAQRLNVGEAGIVRTPFGYHVVERVAPPALDPLESAAILARPAAKTPVAVVFIQIGWKDMPEVQRALAHAPPDKRAELETELKEKLDPRTYGRTKADADKLAQDLLAKANSTADFSALAKQYSEEPATKSGEPIVIEPDEGTLQPYQKLGVRLNEGEGGLAMSALGWLVVKRVPMPKPDPLESADVLARAASAKPVTVQILTIGWKDMPVVTQMLARVPADKRAEAEAALKKELDPMTLSRTKADADKLAGDLLAKTKGGGDFAALIKQYSDEPETKNAKPMVIEPSGKGQEPFQKLALRLNEGEAGLALEPFGWMLVKRIPPPPPDPLESADILARQPVTQKATVKHILLSWKDMPGAPAEQDARAKARSRADLDKLVADTVAKAKSGAKFEDLMKELSEDPGSAARGTSYDVTPDAQLVDGFKNLSLRLNVGEIGVVKSEFGIHIIKRVE